MKTIKFTICLIGFILFFFGCSDEEELAPKVDENGLTKEINKVVPKTILEEMKSLGMVINGGDNPPNIEKTFFASPFILKESNVSYDYLGKLFANLKITFSEQDNNALTIKVDYVSGPETGSGLGSFIVGEGSDFSVFVELNVISSGSPAKSIGVYSGTLTTEGIKDFQIALFMIDDYGDPNEVLIGIGEGRIIYDKDGMSEAL